MEVPAVTEAPIVVDDGDAAYAEQGSNWLSWSESGAYQGDFRYHAAGTGENSATWSFQALDPTVVYQVYATWSAQSNRATNSPFTILDDATSLATVRVNQQLAPNDATISGQGWRSLGFYRPLSGTLNIKLTDDASGGYVIADAVRVEPLVLYWDPDSNPANNETDTGAGLGGDGGWAASGNVWYNPVTGQDVAWVNGAKAVLEGPGGTVTLSGEISIGKITFSGGDYTLQSGTILSAASQGLTIEVARGGSATIASTIAGDGGLTKTGLGTLTLGGSSTNSFTGDFALNEGTVALAKTGGAIALPGNVTITAPNNAAFFPATPRRRSNRLFVGDHLQSLCRQPLLRGSRTSGTQPDRGRHFEHEHPYGDRKHGDGDGGGQRHPDGR